MSKNNNKKNNMNNRPLDKNKNNVDEQIPNNKTHTHLLDAGSAPDKRFEKQLKTEEKTSPSAALHAEFTIDDYVRSMNNFRNYGYEPFIFEFNDELKNLTGITIAKDAQSYKPSNVVPVEDIYKGLSGFMAGFGYTSLRFFLNTKDNVFYKASLRTIYNMLQHPEVEPKLTPVTPGGYVFAAIAVKSSDGTEFLDVRFAKFTFKRNGYVEASGHRGLVDQTALTTHKLYAELPIKDRQTENLNTPYLTGMSKTAPALCVAGEVFIQPHEGNSNEIKDQDAKEMFKVGTAQTGNFSSVQQYHGTHQEVLIRLLFGNQKKFVFFPFPEAELSSFPKNSTAYQARLHELKLQALAQGGFTYEDPENPTVSSSTSTTIASTETKPTQDNNNVNKLSNDTESKSLPSSHLFHNQPTPPSQADAQNNEKNTRSKFY